MARLHRLPRLANYLGRSSQILPLGQQLISGKRFSVAGSDADVSMFLRDLALYLRCTELHPGRLLPLRHDFRHIVGRRSPLGVLHSLQGDDVFQRRLAVWLLGRMNWPRGVS